MWLNEREAALSLETEALLEVVPAKNGLRGLIREAINENLPTRLSEGSKYKPWMQLPLSVYEAVTGDWKPAVSLAVSLGLLKVAAETFDDAEDADSSRSIAARYGSAIAINLATTLLVLAEKALARLAKVGIKEERVVRILDTVNSYYTSACAGQHLDLSQPRGQWVSEDAYLEMSKLKSASAVECSCCSAAMLGTDNTALIDLLAALGGNLGLAAQIANDVQGITSGVDIARGKITLPVIYALTQTEPQTRDQLKSVFLKSSPVYRPKTEKIKRILFQTGSVQYAVIKMECCLQRARDILRQAQVEGLNSQPLNLFLDIFSESP